MSLHEWCVFNELLARVSLMRMYLYNKIALNNNITAMFINFYVNIAVCCIFSEIIYIE